MSIDTHAHYDDEIFNEDREELLEGMQKSGIELVFNMGADLKGCYDTIALSEKYDFVYGAIGIHPNNVEELNEENMKWLREHCHLPKIKAIGEIGLDYYYTEPSKEIQKYWFERQLELAREEKLPIVIHSREAAKDTLDMMKALHAEEIGGVIHCFSYGLEMAKEYIDMGFYIGVGGVVTFKNGKKLKEVVEAVPMDRIVLETDSPYLSPEPNRGKRNNSTNLTFVVEEIAKIRNITAEEVIRQTNKNAKELYRL